MQEDSQVRERRNIAEKDHFEEHHAELGRSNDCGRREGDRRDDRRHADAKKSLGFEVSGEVDVELCLRYGQWCQAKGDGKERHVRVGCFGVEASQLTEGVICKKVADNKRQRDVDRVLERQQVGRVCPTCESRGWRRPSGCQVGCDRRDRYRRSDAVTRKARQTVR